jgi:hypothetical protein
MKVGDLVRCPDSHDFRQSALIRSAPRCSGYIGVVSHVCGYKITVLGGNVVSWDGIEGKRMWDKRDISLVKR